MGFLRLLLFWLLFSFLYRVIREWIRGESGESGPVRRASSAPTRPAPSPIDRSHIEDAEFEEIE